MLLYMSVIESSKPQSFTWQSFAQKNATLPFRGAHQMFVMLLLHTLAHLYSIRRQTVAKWKESEGGFRQVQFSRHHAVGIIHIPCTSHADLRRRPKRSPKKKRNKTFLHASLSKRNKTEDLRDGSCDVWKPGAEICFDAGRQLRSANAWVEL